MFGTLMNTIGTVRFSICAILFVVMLILGIYELVKKKKIKTLIVGIIFVAVLTATMYIKSAYNVGFFLGILLYIPTLIVVAILMALLDTRD